MKNLLKTNLIACFFIILLILSIVGGDTRGLSASAETDGTVEYDSTDVMDDLSGMTIDGVAFSTSAYPVNSSGSLRLLAFVEYGYNFYEDLQDNYGLYVYVYNPAKISISAASTLNYIQLRAGGDTSASYKKYPLEFLSVSEGSGINGLYYKYKLTLTDSQEQTILSALDSSERVYEIGEIELLTIGNVNATAYEIGNKYTYSGYAAGYGVDTSEASTLSCTTAEDVVTISLDVTPTVYRPDGNNGTNEYTQDSLHSVYFSVPNEYIEEYGEMYAVHATWRDAVLNPVLVTGNSDAYAAIEPYLGVDIGETNYDLNYAYVVNLSSTVVTNPALYTAEYAYNYARDPIDSGASDIYYVEEYLSTLYMMFEVTDADNAYIDPDTIQAKMLEMTGEYGGTKINGKYSNCLFESVADDWTEFNYTVTDETDPLTQITVSENSWWKYFLTGEKYTVTSSQTFDGIKAIYKVTDSDFSGSASSNAAALYINENDYSDFKSYYNTATANNQTVFLFRYQVSDYVSREATLYKWNSSFWNKGWDEVDTNAYFAQETVNLDFDIIDLSFKQGEVITVIAVVSSPIDVIGGYTPPLIVTTDPSDFYKYGFAIIAALAVIWVLYYLLDKQNEKEFNVW